MATYVDATDGRVPQWQLRRIEQALAIALAAGQYKRLTIQRAGPAFIALGDQRNRIVRLLLNRGRRQQQ